MATQKAKSQRMSFLMGPALTLLGLGSLAGGFDPVACGWNVVIQIPLRIVLESVHSILSCGLAPSWALLVGPAGLLDGFLRVTASSWQRILTFAGLA